MTNSNQPPARGELNWVQLSTLIEASNLLNATLDHDEVLRQLVTLIAVGVDADCATLYLLDEPRRELRSIVLLDESLHEIHLPLEEGLAGHVARTGETVNVADAYADPRFSRRIDDEAGYRTRTVLAVPMRDRQGRISGVVQALNKRRGLFSEEDELYLLALAEQAALALESARQHAAIVADSERLKFLYRISSLMTEEGASDEEYLGNVLLTVVEDTAEMLEAETCSILMLEQESHRLKFLEIARLQEKQELMEIEVPLEDSIAGWVIQNQQAVIVDDVQNDPRFFSGVDERTGFVSQTMVCVPLKVRSEVIGVLEVLNKRGDALFGEADLQLAQSVANYAALVIAALRSMNG